MPSQIASAAWSALLPDVHLHVRHGGARGLEYTLGEVDFLIGSTPGCDLRVPATDGPALVCLIARHPGGATLRKLTQPLLINGLAATNAPLADGDCIQAGKLEIVVRIVPAAQSLRAAPELEQAQREFQQKVLQFRAQLLQFQAEKAAFEGERQQSGAAPFAELAEIETLREEVRTLRARLADESDRFGQQKADLDARTIELARRESVLADQAGDLDVKIKQYETDVLQFTRRQNQLDALEADLRQQADELTRRRVELQRDGAELEQQLLQTDELRAKHADDEERLTKQQQEQDALGRQLAERSAALEGQQATLTVLRSRIERMREELRTRQQQVDEQAAQQSARAEELGRKQQETLDLLASLEDERKQYALDREQWLQRGAVMDAAVRHLKLAQAQLMADEERVRREAEEVAARAGRLVESDSILQGRLTQLAETQERLETERQSLRDRSVKLVEREQACESLQDQLHRRSEEIGQRQKEIADRMQEYQAKFAEMQTKEQAGEERDRLSREQVEAARIELEKRADAIRMQHAEVIDFEDKYKEQMNRLAVERKSHAEERALFHLEQQTAVAKLADSRAEFDSLRQEAHGLIQQLPDAELRSSTALDRLGHARTQLRSHLSEIHQYVRQCQDEMESLRGKLQGDLDRLQAQEQSLRQNQDEHRLAMAAFRQQLIDWQGQIAELKRLLARDQTRLDRKSAQADERVKEIEAATQRLAQHEEDLQQQERDVADRRLEIDSHLVDMRQWYRRKLRDLAGIPLVPDLASEPTILPLPEQQAAGSGQQAAGSGQQAAGSGQQSQQAAGSGQQAAGSGQQSQQAAGSGQQAGDGNLLPADGCLLPAASADDDSIVPTVRSILALGHAADQGDRKLGQVLRDSQLIDPDTLTALLAEARRQRRSLRQVLLASGVITLYQLALIEAGNVQGLMLGPVRVIDRLRQNAHETVFRVFDPRRGVEAVLRHLAEKDMIDAVRPDEFRQRFAQAMLNDPHLANTLEVLELQGRPAALQEWLAGLPATDWPPLAAAPGVCHRLLTQAAQGLAVAHQAGVLHGHLSDAGLLLTGDGVLKIRGLGEPPWLSGAQHDDEPSIAADLQALGKIASGWCTPAGVRKGPKTKPLPDALVSVLYRLAVGGGHQAAISGQPAASGSSADGYRDAGELLDDLQRAAADIPANAEAWDRLLKYVRDHGAPEATLRQSA